MGDMRPAQPHEQTESQFQNRSDVFVHGRYMHPDQAHDLPEPSDGTWDFHAGTVKSAHERLDNLGSPWTGTEPRYWHGRVNSHLMENTPNLGHWEGAHPVGFESAVPPVNQADPGRIPDQLNEWWRAHANRYYRNDWEDKGSTSVILDSSKHAEQKRTPMGTPYEIETLRPDNFTTWRQGVTNALQFGKEVPSHVRAAYEASGGEHGAHANVDTDFKPPHRQTVVDPSEAGPGVWKQLQDARHKVTRPSNRYSMHDETITGFTSTKDMKTYGQPNWGQ